MELINSYVAIVVKLRCELKEVALKFETLYIFHDVRAYRTIGLTAL